VRFAGTAEAVPLQNVFMKHALHNNHGTVIEITP